jgi:hypothetical protein
MHDMRVGSGAAEAHAASPVRIAKTETFILLGDEIALECGDWLTDDGGVSQNIDFSASEMIIYSSQSSRASMQGSQNPCNRPCHDLQISSFKSFSRYEVVPRTYMHLQLQ